MKTKVLERIGILDSKADLLHELESAIKTMDVLLPQAAVDLWTEQEIETARAAGLEVEPDSQKLSGSIKTSAIRHAAILSCSFTVDETAHALQRNSSRVRQRLGKRSLFGIKSRGQWRVPKFQFARDRSGKLVEINGLDEVLACISKEAHPVAIFSWFTTPNTELWDDESDEPMKPIDWLLHEKPIETIKELAREL